MKRFCIAALSGLAVFATVPVAHGQGGHLVLNPTQLQFTAVHNKSLPVSLSFNLLNSQGSSAINWSVSDNAAWMSENPTSGFNLFQNVTVTINTTALTPGHNPATILVASPNVDNSPQSVAVDYQVVVYGDANCDGVLTSTDIILLVNHVFKGGPAPGPPGCN